MSKKTIDTLVEDIYNLFYKDDLNISEEDVADFGKQLSKIISNRFLEEREKPRLRLSNLGEKCNRKLYLNINTPENVEKMQPQTLMKFLYGDILEALTLFLAKIAGHSVEGQQTEVEINGVKGRRDVILDGCLVDVKSASSFSFAKFEKGLTLENDPFNYTIQINSYLEGSKNDPLLIEKDKAYFLVIDKTLGHLLLSPAQILNNHNSNFKETLNNLAQDKQNMLASKKLPPRGYLPKLEGVKGNKVLDVNCSYCSVKNACYPNLRTFLYSKGPVFFTDVVKEPNVPEVKK